MISSLEQSYIDLDAKYYDDSDDEDDEET